MTEHQFIRLRSALAWASPVLAAAGIEDPRREARWLAAHVLGLPPGALPMPDDSIDRAAFAAVVRRRESREPLALISGRRGFWTLDLAVSADTLVPRPETETLIEAALALCTGAPPARILDLGTGTGCLLLAALHEFPGAFGVGVDLSPAAAALAGRNAAANGLAARAVFLAGDWAAPLRSRFDLILSNPPYIPAGDIAGLMPEVRCYEPLRALAGGADGLVAYRAVCAALPDLLAPGGVAVLELGAGQAGQVGALAEAAGLHYLGVKPDLAGIARAIALCRAADEKAKTKKLFGSTEMGS
jgi:release factor glutamine methyltransferase